MKYIAAGGGGTISSAQGNQQITINSASGSTNTYTLGMNGSGTTNISGGDDNYNVTTGTGIDAIVLGAGNDRVTTSGGGGSISTGPGNQTIAINSASGSTDNYILASAGGGSRILRAAMIIIISPPVQGQISSRWVRVPTQSQPPGVAVR